jgi:tRNA threonylcarbamoyladenosine modification (KEOPS) complex  Pcc1 subunit
MMLAWDGRIKAQIKREGNCIKITIDAKDFRPLVVFGVS